MALGLENVAVGELVFVHTYGGWHDQYSVFPVQKITKTQLVVNGQRFNRRTLRPIGADSWSRTRLTPFDAAKWEEVKVKQEARAMRDFLSNYRWNSCDLEIVRKAYVIVNEVKP